MGNEDRSRRALLDEIRTLRAQVARLERVEEERRRAEEELQRERDLTRSLVASSVDGILAYDRECRYTIWNPGMVRISGVPKEETLGRCAFDVFPFLKQIGEDEYFYAALEGKTVVAKDRHFTVPETGQEGYFEGYYSPLRGPTGEIIGGLAVIREVTERKRAEEALKRAHEELELRVQERTSELEREIAVRNRAEAELRQQKDLSESLIASSVDGILAFDRECRYTIWNPAMEKMSGLSREQVLGRCAFDVFPFLKDIGEDVYFYAALDGRTVVAQERSYVVPETGKQGLFEAFYSPLHSPSGEILGGLAIIHDITERKQLEQERLRASKLDSLSLLAGGLAHDFNNILTIILGNLSVARLCRGSGEIRETLGAAETACLRATRITEQLLTFAKGGAPVKKTASVAELLQESASFAVRGSKARCEFALAPDLWPAEVDQGQISQVINNVILNACQAMPEGGTIRVRAANVTLAGQEVPTLAAGRYLRLAIADEGVGIPPEKIEKIFDPYYTTKRQGSGLGLASSYSIVKNHGGAITVESQLGAGSTFHIYLPASSRPLVPEAPHQDPPLFGHARILLMDDEEAICQVVTNMLAHFGFEVVTAHDGAEAIRCYQEAQNNGRPFDLVMLDLTVPGGMGGRETIQKLRDVNPRVKAIVASGYSDDPVISDFRHYGFDGRISKPFHPWEINEVIREVLRN